MFGYKNQGERGHLIEGDRVTPLWQCVHCNAQFKVERGSGTKRGYCFRCQGPLCGNAECAQCLPFENWLELKEKGNTRLLIRPGVLRKVTIKERPV